MDGSVEKNIWLVVQEGEDQFFRFCQAGSLAFERQPLLHWEKKAPEAQAFLQSNRVLPRLIVLDIERASVAGLRLLEWVRRHSWLDLIPFAILSRSLAGKEMTQFQRLGASQFRVNTSEVWRLVRTLKEMRRLSEPQWQNDESAAVSWPLTAAVASVPMLVQDSDAVLEQSRALLFHTRKTLANESRARVRRPVF